MNDRHSAAEPWFSIVLSTYNRSGLLRRCLESCLAQSFRDFEVVVVDDGSTDDTACVVNELRDRRINLIRHEQNRGLCAARDTGARHARGRWLVQLDSDHALVEGGLENLRARTAQVPEGIGIVGSRYRWDTGRITPAFVPPGPIDYVGRIKWVEQEGGTDYLCCYRRELYGSARWPSERRGPLDGLFQLDLAKATLAQVDADVVAIEYSDADNSQTRSTGTKGARTLLSYADDMAWQFDEILRKHGAEVRRHAPRLHSQHLRSAALFHFLAGDRAAGARYAFRYLAQAPLSPHGWAIAILGLSSRRALAYAKAART